MSYPKVLTDIYQRIDRGPHARQRESLYEYLDSVGDGTGWFDAITDCSGASVPLLIAPPAGKNYRLWRMLPFVRDTGSLDADGYGNGGPLVNGIAIEGQSHGIPFSITGRRNLKTNASWARLCHDVRALTFGLGDEVLTARFSFFKAGIDIELVGDRGDYLRVVLNDSFTFLNEQTFQVQGFQY